MARERTEKAARYGLLTLNQKRRKDQRERHQKKKEKAIKEVEEAFARKRCPHPVIVDEKDKHYGLPPFPELPPTGLDRFPNRPKFDREPSKWDLNEERRQMEHKVTKLKAWLDKHGERIF